MYNIKDIRYRVHLVHYIKQHEMESCHMPSLQRTNSFNWFLFLTVLCIAANLRAPITSVGVALPTIKDALQLSINEVSLLTILPLIAFAVVSLYVAKISSYVGLEKTLFFALILLLIGIIIRSLTTIPALFIGTILIGIGIAFGNVLAPSMIKAHFASRVGVVTGYYTVVMNIFGGLSSYLTAPLIARHSYPVALGIIGIVTAGTIIILALQLRKHSTKMRVADKTAVPIWKSPLAWQITLLMGGQSFIFYVLINWLPEMLLQKGIDTSQSGFYLLVLQIAILPFTFIMPIIAAKRQNQVALLLVTGVLFTSSTVGLAFAPASLLLFVIITLGIASGCAFGLVTTLFALRTESTLTATKLSGMAQAVGYLFAAIGPLFFGLLHEWTGTWTLSLAMLIVISVLILTVASGAGRNLTIEASLKK